MTIKEQLSLTELESFDHRAPRNKTERRFCCPFCGTGKSITPEHRSLAVNTNSGVWMCHRCSRNGLLTEYWDKSSDNSYNHINKRSSVFRESKQVLKKELLKVNQTLGKSELLPVDGKQKLEKLQQKYPTWIEAFPNSEASNYLQKRGIAQEVAQASGCGYASEWQHWEKVESSWSLIGTDKRVIFPIKDKEGNLVAVSARAIDQSFLGPKAMTIGKKSLGVFDAPNATGSFRLIIVEAPIDALSLAVAGFASIAIIGTSWPDWLWRRCAFLKIGIGFDADEPGDIAAKKIDAEFRWSGSVCVRCRPEEGKDWNEILVSCGVGVIQKQVEAMFVDFR